MRKQEEIKFNPREFEKKWQKVWQDNHLYSPDLNTAKKPFYNLMMFPYPSAEGLHVGNMYAFTGSDVYGRFKRMQGNEVFEPIGLDGFGIHSENYALKVGKHPMDLSKTSQENFYRQLHEIGNGYDWQRTLETYDPNYYKWTQWLFIQMFKHRLAYRKKAEVNWCPSCKTVLSDEQVIGGECERCGSIAEKKQLEQWFFKITDYAERLLQGLEKINWSEKIKNAQKNWIGRSEGARIEFKVQNSKFKIEVFTTRPDTLFGATFLVLSPEHPFVASLLNLELRTENLKLEEIKEYVEKAKKKTPQERIENKEKTGVFTGLFAINPATNDEITIYIADYVLMSYGTGAIMAVPAHDERDFEFAKKYNLNIKPVIGFSESRIKNQESGKEKNHNSSRSNRDSSFVIPNSSLNEAYVGEGTIINSNDWNGWKTPESIGKVIAWLEEKGIGEKETHYHLRDWLISRQRYWGPPIPMIYCEVCAKEGKSWFDTEETKKFQISNFKSQISNEDKNIGNWKLEIENSAEWNSAGWYPISEENLPVELPYLENYQPKGSGESPLAQDEKWVNVACPSCGNPAKRETDVSDNFFDSAWYYLRYLCTDCEDIPFPSNKFKVQSSKFKVDQKIRWLPVNMYIGGAEHAVLHLLYVRFVAMALFDWEYVNWQEPFPNFFAHGLIIKEGVKMSKSKGNIVNPDSYIEKYGADTLRAYLMFLGPLSQGGDFRDSGIEGMARFLRRVWTLLTKAQISNFHPPVGEPISNERKRMMHKTIKKVTDGIERFSYNTSIAALMEWYNFLSEELRTKNQELKTEEVETFLKLLAPIAPFMTEEIYSKLKVENGKLKVNEKENNSQFSIHFQPWPKVDEKYLQEDKIVIVVQINGKKRNDISISAEELNNKEKVESMAKESVRKYIEDKEPKKTIYVPGKIVNFVI